MGSALALWLIRHSRECRWCGLFTASFAIVSALLWL
jgi:hypothetical protein